MRRSLVTGAARRPAPRPNPFTREISPHRDPSHPTPQEHAVEVRKMRERLGKGRRTLWCRSVCTKHRRNTWWPLMLIAHTKAHRQRSDSRSAALRHKVVMRVQQVCKLKFEAVVLHIRETGAQTIRHVVHARTAWAAVPTGAHEHQIAAAAAAATAGGANEDRIEERVADRLVPERRSLHLLGTNDGSCLSRRYGVCGEGRGAAVVETRKEGPSVAATFRQLAPSTFRGKQPGKPIPCSRS